jgi:hypothetical protein
LTLKRAVPKHPQVAERMKQKLPADTQRTARCQEVAQYPMSIDDHKDTLRLIFTDSPLYQTCPTTCRCPISGTPSCETSKQSRQSKPHPEMNTRKENLTLHSQCNAKNGSINSQMQHQSVQIWRSNLVITHNRISNACARLKKPSRCNCE